MPTSNRRSWASGVELAGAQGEGRGPPLAAGYRSGGLLTSNHRSWASGVKLAGQGWVRRVGTTSLPSPVRTQEKGCFPSQLQAYWSKQGEAGQG